MHDEDTFKISEGIFCFLSTTPVIVCKKLGGTIPNLSPMEIILIAKSIPSGSQSACRDTRNGMMGFLKGPILGMMLTEFHRWCSVNTFR